MNGTTVNGNGKAEKFNQIVRGGVTLMFATTACVLAMVDAFIKGGDLGVINSFTVSLTTVLVFWFAKPNEKGHEGEPTPPPTPTAPPPP